MRKTLYDSYVEVYMTCEERCGLHRLMAEIEECVIHGDNKSFTDIREMRAVAIEDIKVLHDLTNFVYEDTPGRACKSNSVDAEVRKIQCIKRTK